MVSEKKRFTDGRSTYDGRMHHGIGSADSQAELMNF